MRERTAGPDERAERSLAEEGGRIAPSPRAGGVGALSPER